MWCRFLQTDTMRTVRRCDGSLWRFSNRVVHAECGFKKPQGQVEEPDPTQEPGPTQEPDPTPTDLTYSNTR
jgi:hypothetical protein